VVDQNGRNTYDNQAQVLGSLLIVAGFSRGSDSVGSKAILLLRPKFHSQVYVRHADDMQIGLQTNGDSTLLIRHKAMYHWPSR
jgi:hypothetical protein